MSESGVPGRRVLTASASLRISLSQAADCDCGTVEGKQKALGPSGAAGRRRGERAESLHVSERQSETERSQRAEVISHSPAQDNTTMMG